MPPTDAPSTPPSKGSLAHTGADSRTWLLAAGGLLITVGGGALIAVRGKRRRTRRRPRPPTDRDNGHAPKRGDRL
ncbi:LPXTG cell wall anchor domain-containing protein [Streptomyces sp. NPDC059202]|uniref:LPXTG cell wall anchor domain-containing protein n=1 Tax=unclassified Streptomyces TaxID=2593676 RepID=UPI0036652D46